MSEITLKKLLEFLFWLVFSSITFIPKAFGEESFPLGDSPCEFIYEVLYCSLLLEKTLARKKLLEVLGRAIMGSVSFLEDGKDNWAGFDLEDRCWSEKDGFDWVIASEKNGFIGRFSRNLMTFSMETGRLVID